MQSRKEMNPPALLIDASGSINPYRAAVMEHVDEIAFPYNRFFFSESLSRTMPEQGRYTDITRALVETQKLEPEAILLLSDGNHNYGESPLSLRGFDVPVYSFGVGGDMQRDAAIVGVAYPEYVHEGDSIHIEVTVETRGFEHGEAEVQLKLPFQKREYRHIVPLSDVVAKHTVEFIVLATQSGEQSIQIFLAPQAGEQTYDNNELDISLDILQSKIAVVYYTDHLSFTTKFMLTTLSQDTHVELFPFGRISKNQYQALREEHRVKTIPDGEDIDVIILDNVNLAQIPWREPRTLLQQGTGILCMGSLEGITDTWREILPITVTTGIMRGEYPITIVEPFSCLGMGNDYPPFSTINRPLGIQEDAVVIATTNRFPIIAYRMLRNGVVFQINTTDIGTWHFLQGSVRQENVLSSLMADIVRFLSPLGHKGRLVLKSLHQNYLLGDVITVMLQSFDRDFTLQGGGDFYTEVDDERIPFFEIHEGTYEATFVASASGTHELQALGKLGDEVLTSNSVKIQVSPQITEIGQGLNVQLLKNLSEKTGGAYYPVEKLATFRLPESEPRYAIQKITFHAPLFYILTIVFLALDWIMRRRRGMV
jgi:hypothetical protein